MDLVDHRQIIEILERDIAESEKIGKPFHHKFPMSANYREVFESTLPKIGSLPPDVVRDVIVLYNYIKGIAEDLRMLDGPFVLQLSLPDAIKYLRELVSTFRKSQEMSSQLIRRLQTVAGIKT